MTQLTLWIICRVLFDTDVSGKESELGKALTYTFRHFSNAITNPLRLPLSWPTPGNRCAYRALSKVNAAIYHMIEERRQSSEEREDLLSRLLVPQGEDSRK